MYQDVIQLLETNPGLSTDIKSIVYFKNNPYGFGSSITVQLQNMYYLHSINPNIICLPLFCENTNHFKYHDKSMHNSFFLYFKYNYEKIIADIHNYTIYFTNVTVLPFEHVTIQHRIPPIRHTPNDLMINYFRANFTLRIGDDVIEYINSIKRPNVPLIGVHMRSLAQKRAHHPEYLTMSMYDRIKDLYTTIYAKYPNCVIYIATDVTTYIQHAISICGNVNYLDNISRINNEDDSIPQLTEIGFKLGSDILRESLALSLCDIIYVSNSNIPFLINLFNPDIEMIEW